MAPRDRVPLLSVRSEDSDNGLPINTYKPVVSVMVKKWQFFQMKLLYNIKIHFMLKFSTNFIFIEIFRLLILN